MARASRMQVPFHRNFRLDDYVFYLMSHVEHLYSSGMARTLARHGISRSMWRCLAALSQHKGISIGELGRKALLKQSTVSRILDRMERNGLVLRRPRRGDERVTEVHLTAAGRYTLDPVFDIAGQVYARAIQGLRAAELTQFRRVLKRMYANLETAQL
jgi:DNA-binding MarR family transcriptional regulator